MRGLAILLWFIGSASALDLSAADVSLKLRAAPEVWIVNDDSPFAAASSLHHLGDERGRGEVELRMRYESLTAALSGQFTSRDKSMPAGRAVLNELYYDTPLLGLRLTIGKRVISWDVGFGFRPLDVIQQETRRELLPFSLEGVPLVALEAFGENDALTLVYANPLRGQAPVPRDDESVALRYFRREGKVDMHIVARWSQRTQIDSGVALSTVIGEILECHGSFLYRRNYKRTVDSLSSKQSDPPLSQTDPAVLLTAHDGVYSVIGATVTPGWKLSFLAEAWFDSSANTKEEWKAMALLANRQRALLDNSAVPRDAVLANLAYGALFFDRQNLLRQNLFLRISQKWERIEPVVDVLYTPEDGGWVATGAVTYEAQQFHLEVGGRVFGGKEGSAYRLFPALAIAYASFVLHF